MWIDKIIKNRRQKAASLNTTRFTVPPLHRVECREWCNLEELKDRWLKDENATNYDSGVYTDGSVHREDRSGWSFSARVEGKIADEETGWSP